MPDNGEDQPTLSRAIKIAISEMPPPPSKPFFRDSARVISVAAFIFSVASGLFAAYQSWQNDRTASIERVSKLLDDYYNKQEAISKLNSSTQSGFISLLQSESRSIASKLVTQALKVRAELDDGTWQALAQINDAEGNFKASEQAWSASIEHTEDGVVYLFGLRGVAIAQTRNGKITEGEKTFQRIVDGAGLDSIPGGAIKNSMTLLNRAIFEAETHRLWIVSKSNRPCAFLVYHFDKALALLTAADNNGGIDRSSHGQVVALRAAFDGFRRERAACPQSDDAPPLADDFCSLSENLISSASLGFSLYLGKPDADGSSFESRVDYAGGFCNIDSTATFHCDWSDNNEKAVKERRSMFLEQLASCKNLGPSSTSVRSRDSTYSVTEVTTVIFPRKAELTVRAVARKPSASSPVTRWSAYLDIVATTEVLP